MAADKEKTDGSSSESSDDDDDCQPKDENSSGDDDEAEQVRHFAKQMKMEMKGKYLVGSEQEENLED